MGNLYFNPNPGGKTASGVSTSNRISNATGLLNQGSSYDDWLAMGPNLGD